MGHIVFIGTNGTQGDHVELRGRSDTAIFGVVTKVFAEHGHNMLSVNVSTPVAEGMSHAIRTR